jgi:GNAT superfamily N-acetyltransferase
MTIIIREATCDDAGPMAQVHVSSWQTTYRGMLPQDFLDQLAVLPRERYWAGLLCAPERIQHLYVAEDDGAVVGFAVGGAERTGKYNFLGELYAIYLLESHQRRGIGKQLVQAVFSELSRVGMNSVLVWVVSENPSRHFYEALGGEKVATQLVTIGGQTVEESGYGWQDITPIIEAGNL